MKLKTVQKEYVLYSVSSGVYIGIDSGSGGYPWTPYYLSEALITTDTSRLIKVRDDINSGRFGHIKPRDFALYSVSRTYESELIQN